MNRREFLGGMAILSGALPMLDSAGTAEPEPPNAQKLVRRIELNGLEFEFDEQTGSLLSLGYAPLGPLLRASRDSGSILDVAYPTKEFAGMRLASRFSQARLIEDAGAMTIRWDQLGPSRINLPLPDGRVSAEVRIRAASDRRSVVMSCRIQNDSTAPVPQVLFPDLSGLQNIDSGDRVQLRFALGWVNPFAGPVDSPGRARFYAPFMWREYEAECGYHLNALRWLDYGSLRGGLSVFQKQWGTGAPPKILTRRSEASPDVLRLAWTVPDTVAPGTSWESQEFWFTPHLGGWAKGIEAYRDYVTEMNPPRELTPVVRDGIGFQTIWMTQSTEPDGAKAAFTYKDIPRVAQDAREHGINEVMLWNWARYGTPQLQFREDLGTREELLEGIRAANQIGVKVVPFINVMNLDNRFAARYGMKPGGAAPWTYHPEMIPAMVPFSGESGQISMDTRNEKWQEDVLRDLTQWIDVGMTSFGWDVFDDNGSSGLVRLIEEVRKPARSKDPNSIFAGEPCERSSLERDNLVLDHTWNWVDYVDAGPLLSVLRTPRFNCNVQDSPRVAKMAFAEGLYINAMPKHPDQPNDTALISEKPVLAAAIKEVAALRAKFLPFFVEGTALGESILSEPVCDFVQRAVCTGTWVGCTGGWVGGATEELGEFKYPSAFVRAHRLGDRLLIIVLNNEEQPKEILIKSQLGFWLPARNGYQINYYDSAGRPGDATRIKSSEEPLWLGKTRLLQPLELGLFEIRAVSG